MSNDERYEARFPFFEDGIFLVASIDPRTLKQQLIFEKVDPTSKKTLFSDKLECIHTAIAKIPYDKYTDLRENPENQNEFLQERLNAISTEEKVGMMPKPPEQIDLDIDENFFAFKSWVQGIAEAGMNALYIQGEIERIMESSVPIVLFLWKCLAKVDINKIPEFLKMIEKECRYDGVYHKASLRANLDVIIRLISGMDILDENKKFTAEMGIPWIPLNPRDRITIINVLLFIAELDAEFLFSTPHWRVKILLAQFKEFTGFSEYKTFFTDENLAVRYAVAKNKHAIKHREFKLLFMDEESLGIRYDALSTLYQNYKSDYLLDVLRDIKPLLKVLKGRNLEQYTMMKKYFLGINFPSQIVDFLFETE